MAGRMLRGVLLVLGIALFGVAAPVRAQTTNGVGTSMTKGHGYSLQIVNGWVLGQGYRPVRVELSTGTASTNEREFRIDVEVRNYTNRRSVTASEKLVIPAGSRRGSVVMTVPQIGPWLQGIVRVYEGGKHLDKLQAYVGISNGWAYQNVTLPSFLCVDDNTIDTSLIPEALQITASGNNNYNNLYANLQTNMINGRPQYPTDLFTRVTPSELPGRWIDYSSADVILMSFDQLAGLAKNQPEAFKAICDNTAAGGNLWIWGAGANWERLAELEELTKLWGPSAAPWYDPPANDLNRGLDVGFASDRSVDYSMGGAAVTASEAMANNDSLKNMKAPPQPPFRLRKAQLGLVLAFSGDRPLGANPASIEDIGNWTWAMNSVGAHRMLGKRRHGASMTDDNPDFWELMIPGVGRAPVTAFRVLITVFVIAIGPVNYFWLKRKRKLHLLLAVVPATAAAVTIALFAYALFTDGLHARVRPRTFTSIDQNRQHAACWARTTYYAGLAPSGGMQFEEDTIVLPIDPGAGRYNSGGSRTVRWDGKSQLLNNGWLASRTPTQYLSIRSRPSTFGLRIKPSPSGEAPTVTNGLGTAIVHLVLCDENGRLYTADATPRGEVCALKGIDAASDLPEFKQYLRSRDAALMNDMQLTDASYRGGGPFSYSYYGQSSFSPDQSEGQLETAIATAESWLRGPITLPPRNYIAIVEQSPEVDYGIDSPEQEMPVHIVHGTW
jgi:hypothetical protein